MMTTPLKMVRRWAESRRKLREATNLYLAAAENMNVAARNYWEAASTYRDAARNYKLMTNSMYGKMDAVSKYPNQRPQDN